MDEQDYSLAALAIILVIVLTVGTVLILRDETPIKTATSLTVNVNDKGELTEPPAREPDQEQVNAMLTDKASSQVTINILPASGGETK